MANRTKNDVIPAWNTNYALKYIHIVCTGKAEQL